MKPLLYAAVIASAFAVSALSSAQAACTQSQVMTKVGELVVIMDKNMKTNPDKSHQVAMSLEDAMHKMPGDAMASTEGCSTLDNFIEKYRG